MNTFFSCPKCGEELEVRTTTVPIEMSKEFNEWKAEGGVSFDDYTDDEPLVQDWVNG